MSAVTDTMWQAYYLTHPDHQGLSLEDAAVEMKTTAFDVKCVLYSMSALHPDLFTDISSGGCRFDNRVSRLGPWCDDQVRRKF